MRKGIPDYFALQDYKITPDDVVGLTLRCKTSDIQDSVIISPVWKEVIFRDYADTIKTISEDIVYEVTYRGSKVTYIRSGIGAPQTGDVVLTLGCTPCKDIIFIGSVGGLRSDMAIGDLVSVTNSICGDGFSNYLKNQELKASSFLTSTQPNSELASLLEARARYLCEKKGIVLNKGVIFSTDSIVAQFFHLNRIMADYNCVGIEMETSAVFNASALIGIRAAALLQLSDVIPIRKSLFSGRTEDDHKRRKDIRKSVLTKIVLDALCDV
jgi:purine-nucleoside phosphorylase